MHKKRIYILVIISTTAIILSNTSYSQELQKREWESRKENRKYWQLPNRVMDTIGVSPGMVIADIGAGNGYFTFRMAKKVGQTGKIYANDIDKRPLENIQRWCKEEGVTNIQTILGEEENPLLPEGEIDLALMVNVFQALKNPVLFLKNIQPALKPEAVLVIIQWELVKCNRESPDLDMEDPWNIRAFSLQYLLKTVHQAGYEVLRIETFLPAQNIYICRVSSKE